MPLFVLFLSIYLFTVAGNLGLILVIRTDSRLHTPMYFFLSNLAFVDFCYSSVITPKMLGNFLYKQNVISFNSCAVQLGCFLTFMVSECLLLASMAYDRYVAICKPLHYVTIMNNVVCRRLILCCWMAGLLIIIPPLSLGLHLEFCDSNDIDHFFCDAVPLLKISCSETWLIEQMIIVCAVLTFIMTLVCVVLSIIHHQDHFTIPFCPAKEKGFFYMFFPYNCGFYHLWNLHLHLY